MKHVSRMTIAVATIVALLLCSSVAFGALDDYDKGDVAAINAMIQNNGLNAKKDDPDGWSSYAEGVLITEWGNGTPRRLTKLLIGNKSLKGKLDLSGLDALEEVHAHFNELTAIDISGCTKLTKIWAFNNGLTSGPAASAVLEELNIAHNKLTSIDPSIWPALRELDVSNNDIRSLAVSGNTALEVLRYDNGIYTEKEMLKTIDVSKNTALKELSLSGHNLESIDLENNTALTKLNLGKNKLKALDVSKLVDLEELECYENYELGKLIVAANTNLTSLNCWSCGLSELDVSNNTGLMILSCTSNLLTALKVDKLKALTDLSCSSNQIKELDVSENKDLKTLWCSDNDLTELNLSNNGNLTELTCGRNKISELDVSPLSDDLSRLDVSGLSDLKALDVLKFKKLTYLDVSNTGLSGINVSGNSDLTYLNCSGLKATTLDLTNNKALETLDISNNLLKGFDFSIFPDLTSLTCRNTPLGTLDVSGNKKLKYLLDCASTGISELKLNENTVLEHLDCSNNELTTLDVSAQGDNLLELDCSSNELAALDLSKNTKLQSLKCTNNKLTALDLSNIDRTALDLSNIDRTANRLHTLWIWGNPLTSFTNVQGHTITVVSSPDKDLAFLREYNVDTDNAQVELSDAAPAFSGWSVEPASVVLESPTNRWTGFDMRNENVKVIANTSQRAFTVTLIDAGDGAEGSGDHGVMEVVPLYAGVSGDRTFGGWQIVDAPNDFFMPDQSSVRTWFFMPAGDVALRVLWGDAFPLIVESLGVGATQGGMRSAGDVIDLYAGNKSGWKFKGWSVEPDIVKLDDATSRSTWFVMPRAEVTATANWEEIFYYHIGKYDNVIQSGSGTTWTPNTDAVILLDVDPDHIADVSADGKYLRVGIDYSVLDQNGNDIQARGGVRAAASGSASLKLLDSYLRTLAPGLYTFSVIIDDPNDAGQLGTAEVQIRVSSTGGRIYKDDYIIGCSSGAGAICALLALISAAAMRKRRSAGQK